MSRICSLVLFGLISHLFVVPTEVAGENPIYPRAKTAAPTSFMCAAPISLSAFGITSTTVLVSWSSVSSPAETAWDLELVANGQSFSGVPTVDSLTVLPFLFTNLSSGTAYRFRVRAHCADGSWSNWSNTHLFRTRLTNPSACAMNLNLADTTCQPTTNHFFIENFNTPGNALGANVLLKSVKIILAHEWDSDLELRLVSPAGKSILLASQVGGSGDNFGNPADLTCQQVCEFTPFCPTASINSQTAQPPFIGKWQPVGNFDDFNDGSNPNGIWRLEICDVTTDDLGILKYVELGFSDPNCMPPTNLSTVVLSPNTVGLSWQNPINCTDSLILEYGLSGFQPGVGGAANGGFLLRVACNQSQPFTIEGLAPLTNYDVYLRKKCGNSTVFSFNSCKKSFFTDCVSPTLSENFNNQNDCGSACSGVLPGCPLVGFWQNATDDDWDWRVRAGTTPSSNTGPDDDVTGGGKYLYTETTCGFIGNILGKKAILRSQCVLVQANAACSMSFNWHLFGANIGSLKLEISTNFGQTWTTLFQKSGNQGNIWQLEFIDLTPFNNQIATFRLVGTGGNGGAGDMAIDEIRFFGSTDAGAPDYVFYRDSDGDGFGNPAAFQPSCSANPPTGFVENKLDCADLNAAINPTAAEIFCNGADENCNGMADDSQIPMPAALNLVSICEKNNAILTTNSIANGQFYWFDSANGGNLLGTGDALTLLQLSQNKNVWLLDSIFDASRNLGCASARTLAQIVVNANPKLDVLENPSICFGDFLSLSELTVIDSANTNGQLTWHDGNPANAGNKLASNIVSPALSTSYTVLSTTNAGCTSQASTVLTVRNLPTASILQGDSIAICSGAQTFLSGTAVGASPFSYAWTGGNLSQSWNFSTLPISNLAGLQTYFFTVKDAFGCASVDAIRVKSVAGISSTEINLVQNATACGVPNGTIKLTPLNGQPPFQIAWDGPTPGSLTNQTGLATLGSLLQGAYQISITDAASVLGGCSMVLPAQIINAPGLAVEIDSIFGVKCPAGLDGRIEINLLAGQNPSYIWSNGATSQDLLGVGSGTFSVTISEGNCQQKLKNLQIVQPSSFAFLPNLVDKVTCHGGSDGKIDLIVSGGTPNFSFFWNNGATSEDLTGLPAGAYRTTLTDQNGCTAVSPFFNILQPAPLVLVADSIRQITCSSDSDGAIFTHATGGNFANYTFEWSDNPSANGSFLTQLPVGNYELTVVDALGCAVSDSFNLNAPPPLSFYSNFTKNPTCVGINDGEISVSGIGGEPPYQYLWSNGSNNSLLTGLSDSPFSLTLTDARGCQFGGFSPALSAPQLIDLQIVSVQNVPCFGSNTGSIATQISGGNSPYSIVWNGSFSGNILQNATAGKWQAHITDGLGCQFLTDSILISQPAEPLAAHLIFKENAGCFGSKDGSVDIEISGGTMPYLPIWNDSLSVEDLTDVGLGFWHFSVTDASGCAADLPTIVVGQPSEILPNATVHQIPCVGSALGSIELAPMGGFANYAYIWNTGATSDKLFQLAPGEYSVTITDGGGCQKEVKSIKIYNSSADFSAKINQFESVSCFAANDGTANFNFTGGTPPFQIAVNSGQVFSTNSQTLFLQNLQLGQVWGTVLDSAGCISQSDTIVIEEPAKVFGFYENWLNPPCAGESTGSILPNIVGGVQPYIYDWSLPNGAQSNVEVLQQVGAGEYQLSVTDFNGCGFLIPSILLTAPAVPLTMTLDSLRHDNCANGSGMLEIQAEGGVPNYEYEWNNGQFGAKIEDLSPGFYQVTVTDDSLCAKVFEYQILANPDPISGEVEIGNVACFGETTGWVHLEVTGGTAPFAYLWNNGATTDSIFGLAKANYFATVTDAVGCFWVIGAVVQGAASAFIISSILSQPALQGQSNGQICAQVSGGNPANYQFFWSNQQTSACATGLATGYYALTATDGNDCIVKMDSLFVDETIATEQVLLVKNYRIQPNPAADQTEILVEIAESALPISCEILDIFGKKIVQMQLPNAPKISINLEVADWPAGIYFVKTGHENQWIIRRLVVVHP